MSPRVAEGLVMAYRDSQVTCTGNHQITHDSEFTETQSPTCWVGAVCWVQKMKAAWESGDGPESRSRGGHMPSHLMNTEPTATATFILDWAMLYRFLHPRMKSSYKYHSSDDPRIKQAIALLHKYIEFRDNQIKVSKQ